jgi:hypothetical protein
MADKPAPQGEVDWASATVKDGELTVALGGTPNAAWARELGSMVERLYRPGHGWGEVKVTKTRLRVAALTPGCETGLRHFLDSAVLQVNTDFAPAEDPDRGDEDESGSDEDRAMTDAFRSFSDDANEDSAQEDPSSA